MVERQRMPKEKDGGDFKMEKSAEKELRWFIKSENEKSEIERQKIMPAPEKLDKMLEFLKSGGVLVLATYTKATQIEQKHIDKWNKSGRPLLKLGNSQNKIYMAEGKNYVEIYNDKTWGFCLGVEGYRYK